MGAKESKIIRSIADSIKRADDRKTYPYDTQATIRRIEGNTAWVHIPGGVDETPVQLTINASEGDTVQVRVSGGRAFLVGNATAPPTDNAYARQVNRTLTQEITNTNTVVKGVQKVVQAVKKIADNTNQYFWHTETGTDTGAHITEIPQEEFLADPENGGGNLLARSNGIAVRDGLTELSKFSASGVYLGENDHVIISPTGSTKYTWEQSYVGEYSVSSDDSQTMIDVAGDAMYDALSDGDQFWFGVVETGSTAILSVVFTKGTQENKNSLNFRFKYDGAGSVNIRPYSSSITSIQLYVRLRTTLYGGIFSFGANNTATGFFSATLGEGLAASQENQVVIGRYNQDNQQALFMIGNGENVDGEITRSNVLVVSPNGDMHHYGSRFITDGDCDFGDTLRKNGYQFIETESYDLGAISITSGTPGTTSTRISTNIEKTGYTPIAVVIRYADTTIIGFDPIISTDKTTLNTRIIRRTTSASSPGYHAYADVTFIKT